VSSAGCPGFGVKSGREFPLHVRNTVPEARSVKRPSWSFRPMESDGPAPSNGPAVVHRQVGTAVHAIAAQGSPQPVRQQLHHAGQVQPEAVGAQVHMACPVSPGTTSMAERAVGVFPNSKFTLVDAGIAPETSPPKAIARSISKPCGQPASFHPCRCANGSRAQIASRGEGGSGITEAPAQSEFCC
jgi:hypothetical protein